MAAKKYKVLSPFLGSFKTLHNGDVIEEKDVKTGDLDRKLGDGHLAEVKSEVPSKGSSSKK